MKVADDFHYIKCPFSRPGYFTGVVAILGNTVALADTGTATSPHEAIFPYLRSVSRKPDEISHIVLTHGHGDHFGGVPSILKMCNARVYVHELDKPLVMDLAAKESFDPSRVEAVKQGDILEVGNRRLEVFHTPGHAAGSVCLIDTELGLCITGDSVQGLGEGRPLLFYSSVAYANSMRRLSPEPLEIFMMGHPFPPFGRGVIRGSEVKKILEGSMKSVEMLRDKIMSTLKSAGRPLTVGEVSSEVLGSREQSVRLVLEELHEDGKVRRMGEDGTLLWLIRD